MPFLGVPTFQGLFVLPNSYFQGPLCLPNVSLMILLAGKFIDHLSFLFFWGTVLDFHQGLPQCPHGFEGSFYPKWGAYSFNSFTEAEDVG